MTFQSFIDATDPKDERRMTFIRHFTKILREFGLQEEKHGSVQLSDVMVRKSFP